MCVWQHGTPSYTYNKILFWYRYKYTTEYSFSVRLVIEAPSENSSNSKFVEPIVVHCFFQITGNSANISDGIFEE